MRTLAAWCHDRRRTVIGLWVAAFVVSIGLWATAAGEFVNNFQLPGTESQRTYDLLTERFPEQSGDTASVVFAVEDGGVLDAANRPQIEKVRAEIEKSPEVLAVGDPFAAERARLAGRPDHLRADPVPRGRGRGRRRRGQDDGGGHARARRPGRRPGGARRRHHPLVDGRAGRRRRDLRPARGGGRAVPHARRGRHGAAAAQRAVRDGREPRPDGRGRHPRDRRRRLVAAARGDDRDRRRHRLRAPDPQPLPARTRRGARRARGDAGRDRHVRPRRPVRGRRGRDRHARHAAAGHLVPLRPRDRRRALRPVHDGRRAHADAGAAEQDRRPREVAGDGEGGDPDLADRESGFAARWSAFVARRPLPVAVLALAVLIALALPALHMRLATSDASTYKKDDTTRVAYDLLKEGFGPGFNAPLLLAVELPSPGDDAALQQIGDALGAQDGIAQVLPPQLNEAGDTATMIAYPETTPQDERTDEVVRQARETTLPPIAEATGARVSIGGTTASNLDFAQTIRDKLPLFIGVVVGLSLLLLMVVFRSLLIPVKAGIFNLLSIAGAFGVVTLIFQDGHLAGLFGDATGPIEAFLPIMVFAVVFGLSMDYEVFLVSRMHEEWVHTE